MKTIFSILLALMPLLATGNPVTWTSSVEMSSATEGTLTIHASIEPGWHIYGLDVAGEPTLSTRLTVSADNPGLTWSDDVTASTEPTSNIDPLFHIRAQWWESEVTFYRHFHIPSGDRATITGEVYYLTCDTQRCAEPTTYRFELPVNRPQIDDTSQNASDADAVKAAGGYASADSISTGTPVTSASGKEAYSQISPSQYLLLSLIALGAGAIGGLVGAWAFTRKRKHKKT